MSREFLDSYSFIQYLVELHGELSFGLSATSYGEDFYWISEFVNSDEIIKLEAVLFDFDEQHHCENDIERGSSREYTLKMEDNILIGKINYHWDYSELGTKWADRDLESIIREEICDSLSALTGLSVNEFLDTYYYDIAFSSAFNNQDEKNLLAKWENDETVDIPILVWNKLKESIIKLSMEHGANTTEAECEFIYDLNDEYHHINESWTEEVAFDNLKNDDSSYKL
jgi:hypothetical protein